LAVLNRVAESLEDDFEFTERFDLQKETIEQLKSRTYERP